MKKVPVEMVVMTVPQAIDIEPEVSDRGERVAHLKATWPMVTMMIEMNEATAGAVIAKLDRIFGFGIVQPSEPPAAPGPDLQIVQSVPDGLKPPGGNAG